MSWLSGWFGYGVGRGVAKAIFGEPAASPPKPPIKQQTEAEIRADEARYAEDAKRLDAEDAKRGKGH